MSDYYIRDPETGVIREALDVLEWGRWFDPRANVVIQTDVTEEVWVSTVFLGLNYRFLGHGPPILFETMVFEGPLDGEQERYETEEDARIGHADMVDRVREALGV